QYRKSASVTSDLHHLGEATLVIFDLIARREIDGRVEGNIDHVFADVDELAPDREIVDGTPVVHRVDDGCRFRGKASEILSQRQSGDVDFGGQKGLQRHRRRQFAGANETARA